MISGKDVRIENGYIIINGEKYPIVQDVSEIEGDIEDLEEKIGDISETGITGDSVEEQLTDVEGRLDIEKVPNTFITLDEGIGIVTNQLYKQGKHIFGWISFEFSAQTPNNLKIGVLAQDYTTETLVRMMAGLGTEAWACENVGYAIKGIDNAIYVTGYNNNIKVAHIHLDYVV